MEEVFKQLEEMEEVFKQLNEENKTIINMIAQENKKVN